MATIKVYVTKSEKQWLKYMAEFHGLSVSDLMKIYSIEQLEDEYDAQVAEIAYKLWLEDKEKKVSLTDIMNEFNYQNRD